MATQPKVGVILIATGSKYHKYIIPQINSIKENFKPSEDVTIFLFTDAGYRYVDKQFYAKDYGYPGSTLWRFRTILKHEKELRKMDYLFYMDVDMLVVDKIGNEILGERVATIHPGFTSIRGSYEDRPQSLACVDKDEGDKYFCGGFNGGTSDEYLKMARQLSHNIGVDYNNNIMAIWHDESHMNRYLIDNPPTKILSPSYCYPEPPMDKNPEYAELWPEKYTPKIYALDKFQRDKLVSIIIPCYKQAHFLSNAIKSALAQTYANVEVIVVNDGSPDNTSEVAREYPVKLIVQKNKGLSSARNAGIAMARGEYFLPLDSDDMIDKDFLMKTVPEMKDGRVAVVYTAMETMNDQYKRTGELRPTPEIKIENLKHNNGLYICSLVRMEVLKQCGGYNPNMIHGYEDWNLWLDICKRGWKFKYVPLLLFKYMIKKESMGVSAFRDWHQWNLNKLKENHPSVYND